MEKERKAQRKSLEGVCVFVCVGGMGVGVRLIYSTLIGPNTPRWFMCISDTRVSECVLCLPVYVRK